MSKRRGLRGLGPHREEGDDPPEPRGRVQVTVPDRAHRDEAPPEARADGGEGDRPDAHRAGGVVRYLEHKF